MLKKLLKFKRPSSRSNRRGAATVEFVLVIPVFALFCAVFLDFSRLSLARHVCQNAVYRAGRLAMTDGVTRADTIQAVNDYLNRFGYEAGPNSIVVGQVYLDDMGRVLPLNTTTEFDSESVEFHVEAAVPFSNATLIFPTFLPNLVGDREIRSEIRVRSERYNGFFNPAEAYAN